MIKIGNVIAVLSDDLRKPQYRANPNKLAGHCYIVAEALYYLSNKSLKPMFVRHEGEPHWFLKTKKGQIIDPTSMQFKRPVPYNLAIGKGFLTNYPSKRCKILLSLYKENSQAYPGG